MLGDPVQPAQIKRGLPHRGPAHERPRWRSVRAQQQRVHVRLARVAGGHRREVLARGMAPSSRASKAEEANIAAGSRPSSRAVSSVAKRVRPCSSRHPETVRDRLDQALVQQRSLDHRDPGGGTPRTVRRRRRVRRAHPVRRRTWILAPPGTLRGMVPGAVRAPEGRPMSLDVLVTGATGFVGARLVAALAEEGHRVRAMTRRPESYVGPGTPVAATSPTRDPRPRPGRRGRRLLPDPLAGLRGLRGARRRGRPGLRRRGRMRRNRLPRWARERRRRALAAACARAARWSPCSAGAGVPVTVLRAAIVVGRAASPGR